MVLVGLVSRTKSRPQSLMSTLSVPGSIGYLTPEQEKTLEEFKIVIAEHKIYDPAKHDDHCLLRFLRARNFKIDATLKMWQDFVKWRLDNGVDEVGVCSFWRFSFPILLAILVSG